MVYIGTTNETVKKWLKKNKERLPEIRKNWRNNSLAGRTAVLYDTVIKAAKSRNLIVTITKQDIRKLLLKSNNKCAITGIEFIYDIPRGPFKPSIDRIDSTKGYTLDNIQIVCWIYNSAKGPNKHSDVIKFATALINFNKEVN